jgi:hypothetical protein
VRRKGVVSCQSGSRLIADVFDLIFLPFPQLLRIGVESLLMKRHNTCPGSEVQENVLSMLADTLRQCWWQVTYLPITVLFSEVVAGGKFCKQKNVSALHCFGHISSMNDRNFINVAPNDTL